MGILLVVLGAIGGYSLMQEKMARASLEAMLKADDARFAKLEADMATRDKQAQDSIAMAQKHAATVKTPQDAIPEINALAGFPVPIALPLVWQRGQSIAIPEEDILPLFQKLETCKEQEILLGACQADRIDLQVKAQLLTAERDQAVSTVRGGTFWQRFRKNAKWVAVVGGVGFASYEIGKHK